MSVVALWSFASFASGSYVQINTTPLTFCGSTDASAYIVSNAPLPWTILWSTGAITDSITGLPAGTYSVELTDGDGVTYTDVAVISDFQLNVFGGTGEVAGYLTGNSGLACGTDCNGVLGFVVSGMGIGQSYANGTPPYSWTFDVPATYLGSVVVSSGFYGGYEYALFSGFCGATAYNATVTDALGCVGGLYDPVMNISPNPDAVSVTPYCANGSMGTAYLDPFPSFPQWPFSAEIWKDGAYFATQGVNDPHSLNGLLPGDYVAYCQGFDNEGWPVTCGIVTLNFTILDLGPNCGVLQGQSWYDEDADCVFDGGELGMAGAVLGISPGGQYAYIGGSGQFSIQLPAGNYSLTQLDPYVDPICPVVQPIPFTVAGGTTTVNLANGSTEPMDIALYLSDGVARPGFDQSVHGSAQNPTPQATGPVTLTCTFDAQTTFLTATPPPSIVAGNSVTWDYAALNYFGSAGFSAMVSVPSGVPIGTMVTHTCSVSNTLIEATLTNNGYSVSEVVMGSFDPNDKTARTSSGWSDALYYIDQDEWIDYTIRFQNTGTDTAFTVVITDTLAAELDMSSFVQGAVSHPVAVAFRAGRVVKWTFNNILLPDSNANEAASHGLVAFRIKPRDPVLPGTVISNTANIYFDYNDPVITAPSVLTAEFSTGVPANTSDGFEIYPNPARDHLTIHAHGTIRRVIITSMDGRAVSDLPEGNDTAVIDTSRLPGGSYVIASQLATGAWFRKSFAVIRTQD
ncbi:MAG: T9SS type A sorting domain-containing protein [Flavobacteriales bacterium]